MLHVIHLLSIHNLSCKFTFNTVPTVPNNHTSHPLLCKMLLTYKHNYKKQPQKLRLLWISYVCNGGIYSFERAIIIMQKMLWRNEIRVEKPRHLVFIKRKKTLCHKKIIVSFEKCLGENYLTSGNNKWIVPLSSIIATYTNIRHVLKRNPPDETDF